MNRNHVLTTFAIIGIIVLLWLSARSHHASLEGAALALLVGSFIGGTTGWVRLYLCRRKATRS
jgi:uncharacterized membrane protein